jgi:hypothetical protein
MMSKTLSCFYLLFIREENIISSRKNLSRRHASSLLQCVGNEHTLKLVTRPALRKSTPKSVADENSASSPTASFQHFERFIFSSSRMNADTPRFSRHDVRYRRVNLKT